MLRIRLQGIDGVGHGGSGGGGVCVCNGPERPVRRFLCVTLSQVETFLSIWEVGTEAFCKSDLCPRETPNHT